MTLKKDDAINDILKEFEEFANLVLRQLDSLEKIITSGETKISDEVSQEVSDNEKKLLCGIEKYEDWRRVPRIVHHDRM